MSSYPIEANLRSIVEYYSAALAGVAGSFVLNYPSWFLLSSVYAEGIAGLLFLLGLKRAYEGYKVKRYQKRLKRLNIFACSSSKIPVSNERLYLGKGFRWLPKHTQRIHETQQKHAEKYLKPSKLYCFARYLEAKLEKLSQGQWLRDLLMSQSRLNPVKPLPPIGGNPVLHAVEPREVNVTMPLSERVSHMLVLGTTRVGKTRFLEVQVTQDIRRGDPGIVFDPKGDSELLRRVVFEAKQCGREDDVLIFHLGFPTISARYNPIGSFARITEVANRVANQLPGSGESAAFKEFAWRFVNIIAKSLVALGRKPDYKQIQRYILNIDNLLLDYCKLWLPTIDPNWELAIDTLEQAIDTKHLPLHLKTRSRYLLAIVNYIQTNLKTVYDPIADGLCSAFNYDKSYFDKITASLLPLLEKLTTGQIAELLSPNYEDLGDTRPIFDWLQVIRGKKIV
jgi:conjugative coupling factor TraD (TOL family)